MTFNYSQKKSLVLCLTSECNLRCVYCIPENTCKNEIQKISEKDAKFIINSISSLGIKKLELLGGEICLYEELEELISYAKVKCGIEHIKIYTNAELLKDKLGNLKKVGLDEIDINLNTIKEYKQKMLTSKSYISKVINSINEIKKQDIKININFTVINGVNTDEIDDYIEFAKTLGILS